jgi:hypothetical protein
MCLVVRDVRPYNRRNIDVPRRLCGRHNNSPYIYIVLGLDRASSYNRPPDIAVLALALLLALAGY